jgi:hypothetical protein
MQIQIGTVIITNSSNIVDANPDCDSWSDAQIALSTGVPVLFSVQGDIEVPYPVTSVKDPATSGTGNWQLTLATNFEGATNAAATYTIHKDFTPNLELPLFAAGDTQTAQILSRAFTTLDGLGGALLTRRNALQDDLPLTTTLQEIPDLTVELTQFEDFRLIYGLVFQGTPGTDTGLQVQQQIVLPGDGVLNTYGANALFPSVMPSGNLYASILYFTSTGPGTIISNIASYASIAQADTQLYVQVNGLLNVAGQGSLLQLFLAATNNLNSLTLKQGSYVELQEMEF